MRSMPLARLPVLVLLAIGFVFGQAAGPLPKAQDQTINLGKTQSASAVPAGSKVNIAYLLRDDIEREFSPAADEPCHCQETVHVNGASTCNGSCVGKCPPGQGCKLLGSVAGYYCGCSAH